MYKIGEFMGTGAVIHLDANYFYAQIEAIFRLWLRGKAYVVGGDQESRKGIVLTKSPLAKKYGIKTAMSIREALNIYPNLIVVPANFPLYSYYSDRMREIVLQHTDAIKPFGSDEMWAQLYGDRTTVMKTVENIRQELWKQLCLTVSIGVGDNLPYAKIGSDLAPNDGVCVLWNENREKEVYPLPVGDLLYVGASTTERLNRYGIQTIGDLANSDPERICDMLKNKTGKHLWIMANGQDKTRVEHIEKSDDAKSFSNSNTLPYDLKTEDDVRAALYMFSETVAQKMKEAGVEATTLSITVRDDDLFSTSRQMKLQRPTNLVADLVPAAMALFKKHYKLYKPVRTIGICASNLVAEGSVFQLSLFDDEVKRRKQDSLERFVDRTRGRFGQSILKRAVHMDRTFKGANANNEHGDSQLFYVYR